MEGSEGEAGGEEELEVLSLVGVEVVVVVVDVAEVSSSKFSFTSSNMVIMAGFKFNSRCVVNLFKSAVTSWPLSCNTFNI